MKTMKMFLVFFIAMAAINMAAIVYIIQKDDVGLEWIMPNAIGAAVTLSYGIAVAIGLHDEATRH